jgi:hypothetical protein
LISNHNEKNRWFGKTANLTILFNSIDEAGARIMNAGKILFLIQKSFLFLSIFFTCHGNNLHIQIPIREIKREN